MKNKKLNILILLVAVILVLYFTLKDNFIGIVNQILKTNIFIFIIAIMVFLLSLLFKAASLRCFVKDYNNKYSLKEAYSLTLISQFLNGVTPFQSGGQPFQIYLLKKDGIRIMDSTSALLKDFISFQTALIIISFAAVIINLKYNMISYNKYLNFLIIMGFLINIVVLTFLFLTCVAKNTGTKIFNKLIDFTFKFRFTKKFRSNKDKIKQSLEHFYETSSNFKNNKLVMFKSLVYNIVHLILLYMVPFIIFIALGYNKVTLVNSLVSTSFVMIIGNFIPIPGATGGIEYGFMQIFGNFAKGSILSSTMLLWRGITYFLGIITGAVALLFKRKKEGI